MSTRTFNPAAENVLLTVSLPGAAGVVATVEPAAGGAPVRELRPEITAGELRLGWDGRDGWGNLAPTGAYRFRIEARDTSGRPAAAMSDPVQLTDKLILVSINRQELFAYQGHKTVVQTLVTTGGPELPSPIGIFHVLDKTSPLVMYSPWPKGSPNWYPDSTVQYALEFYENASYGLYIHDASWRSDFGPGSNETAGTPGEDGTGTHGCINVPTAEQATLYRWADVGTPVVVQL